VDLVAAWQSALHQHNWDGTGKTPDIPHWHLKAEKEDIDE